MQIVVRQSEYADPALDSAVREYQVIVFDACNGHSFLDQRGFYLEHTSACVLQFDIDPAKAAGRQSLPTEHISSYVLKSLVAIPEVDPRRADELVVRER